MSTIEILPEKTLRDMKKLLDNASGLQVYQEGASYQFLDEKELLSTTIEVVETAPELEVHGSVGNDLNDTDNALKIYSYLGRLNRTQASDPRLWATLTHTTFWDYCLKRWPNSLKEEDNKSRNYILEHWFETPGAGLAALRRNAISRLWWGAHLTVAPWEDTSEFDIFQDSDRTIYTSILLSQQQIFFDVLERSYGSSPKLRICLLDALKKYLPEVSNKDNLSKAVSKKLRLVLKGRHLEALPVKDLRHILHDMVEAEAEALLKAS